LIQQRLNGYFLLTLTTFSENLWTICIVLLSFSSLSWFLRRGAKDDFAEPEQLSEHSTNKGEPD
jgi:hypothetical protein